MTILKTQIQKLVKLSICPCGFTLLDESIKLGTEYVVYPESIQREAGFTLVCGGCNQETRGRGKILAQSILNPSAPPAPLPIELFGLGDEWPEEIDGGWFES